jgi:hypothetical protein
MRVDVRLRNKDGAYTRFRIGADPLEGSGADTHWLALVTPLAE